LEYNLRIVLKRLALVGLLFISFVVHIDAQEAANPAPQAQDRQHPSPSTPSAVVVKQDDAPALQSNNVQEKSGSQAKPFRVTLPPRDKYDWIAYGASLLLVLVGIAGVAVGVFTLVSIKAQVIEMQRQAGLMKTQADHMEAQTKQLTRQNQNMLTVERAWVVESIRFLDEIPRRPPSGGGVLVAIVTLKNIGKQPAFLKICQTRFHASEILPEMPEFRSSEVFPEGYMLAPDRELLVRATLEEGSFDDEQVDRIQGRYGKKSLSLRIYGYVVYESVGVRGTNRFCYTWRNLMGLTLEGDKARFEKAGPPGYNQHT
jgi:hypothetical protein